MMKAKHSIHLVFLLILAGIILFILSNCSKDSEPTPPTVTTAPVKDITSTTATTGGTLISNGGDRILFYGVCCSTISWCPCEDNTKIFGNTLNTFSCTLMWLTPNTQYYVRAFASNEHYDGYGDILTFKTAK